MRSPAGRAGLSEDRHAAANAAPSRKNWLQTNPRSRAVSVVMIVASALALTFAIMNYWSLSSSMGRPLATRSLLHPFPPLMPSKIRPPRPALPPRPDNRPTLWVTVLDSSITGRVGARIFKRHMVTKYKYGKIEWERMGILATPEAPQELVLWAQNLGVSTFNVSELSCATARNTGQPGFGHRMTQAYAWCMEEYRQVVFMDVRTIVMHDINGLVAGCEGGDGVGLCAVATGEDLPYYKVDPGVMVAFPSKDRCEDLARIASMPRFRTASCAKTLFNTYFTYEERMVVDPRFNTITFETKTVHKLKDAFVIQYAPSHVPSTARADFSILFRKVDRVVDLFSAELKNRTPWHVLYATLLTPPTQEGEAVITSSAALMKHFVSQFALGKIPWKNQAIIYTENAYPEVREWLVAKGGHAIKVPSLLCPNPRGARSKYGFTKLQLFGLKDWDVVVHIDPGTIILDDITRLWRACPSEFNLCLVEEPEHKPEAHYPNDGVLVTRPDTAFYRRIMNGRKRFSPSRTPCETDFFYRFLKPQGYGLLDPKYNMMAFDPYRRLGFVGAKIIRTDLLEKGGSREERSFLDAKLDEISELSLQYNISDSDSTTERKTGLWFFLP